MRQDKDGNIYYNYGINGIAVSATVSIVLTGEYQSGQCNHQPELLRKYVDHERLFLVLTMKAEYFREQLGKTYRKAI